MPEPKQDALIEYGESFLKRIKQLKKDLHKKYMDISNEPTPQFDGSGKAIIKKRPDGLDYLEESYMRTKLDQHFPGWSWQDGQIQFLGSEWIIATGHLIIIEEYLMPFLSGIIPPYRKYFGTGAARIQFKREMPHTAENVIDIDKNVKAANSNAFKVAINRLCRIGDDVYGKRIDEEGAGSLEDIISSANTSPNVKRDMFFDQLTKKKILHSIAMKALNVTSWNEITNWEEAYNKIFKEEEE